MTFEEFFRKKKIDLVALQALEGSLFSEFKTHYEQMGEKSFDHTKKYWFNKLRRQFPAAQEIRTEKVRIENPLAEQTITESLAEPVAPVPKLGFAPKFKASNIPKPAEEKPETTKEIPPLDEQVTVKPAFKPRFNPGMVKLKSAGSETNEAAKPKPAEENVTPAAETKSEKPAYKPRFKTGMAKPEPTDDAPISKDSETGNQENTEISETTGGSKLACKPRFQAGMAKPKSAETEEKPNEKAGDKIDLSPPAEEPPARPAYKPRFNMKTIPPKATEE